MASLESPSELSWRIPGDETAVTIRRRFFRIVLILFTAYVVVLWLFGADWRLPSLAMMVFFVAFMIWFIRSRRGKQLEEDNVHLTQDGLVWIDAGGQRGELPRARVQGFRIGLDPQTMRAIPALTLVLASGFESQPIELHGPATPVRVRQFLTAQLGLEEQPRGDELFADQVHRDHLATLRALPNVPENILLRHSLVSPQSTAFGQWRIGQLADVGDLLYDRETCSYVVDELNAKTELDSLHNLLEFVRNRVLPSDRDDRRKLLSKLAAVDEDQDLQDQIRDARDAGFYLEIDPAGNWHFTGSRQRLLTMCDWVETTAQELPEPFDGARPQHHRLGGDAMSISVEVAGGLWFDDYVISGSPTRLGQLADTLRGHLSQADSGDEFTVAVQDASDSESNFRFHLQSDDADPSLPLQTAGELTSDAV